MDQIHGLASLPLPDGAARVVTVGFFDGVHLGHRAVFDRVKDVARERGLPTAAVTFDRHPREILTPGSEPKLLTTLERKAALIADLGIDALVVLEFTDAFSKWPATDFVTRVLVDGVHAAHVVVGENFTFGYRALGNLDVLHEAGAPHGMSVEGVPLRQVGGRPVSSSAIREDLARGELEWPAHALGRRYAVDGTVAGGAGRGVSLGFPTANLLVDPRILLPAEGVYAGKARVEALGEFTAAINVGTNPTFGDEPLHAEAYLLDFEGDLRGRAMAVEFWERLRDEVRFDSPEALVRQMKDDVDRTRSLVA